MVSFTVVGEDSRDATLEGFEGDHTMGDVRDYWEEHFPHIGWSKTTTDEAISIDKGAPVPWSDVVDQELNDLAIVEGCTVQLVESHVVG